MRETPLLEHIYQRSRDLAGAYAHVLVGPGDDCAVLATGPGAVMVTVDHAIEGRHFVRGTPWELVARKAMARSVSDIAAMAGRPAWSLATAALPPEFPQADAAAIVDHLNRFAARWGCPVVGGDVGTTEPGAPAVLTVTVAGLPHPARGPVLRSTARPGDHCWMTGRLGGSFPSGRHLTFEPRIAEARWLADRLGPDLHAMIDLSDGLGRDAARVAQASGVRVRLESALFPLHPATTGGGAEAPAGHPAADGEDYELFFTTAPGVALPEACPVTGTPLTRIGSVLPVATGTPWSCVIADADGREWDCAALGWEH